MDRGSQRQSNGYLRRLWPTRGSYGLGDLTCRPILNCPKGGKEG